MELQTGYEPSGDSLLFDLLPGLALLAGSDGRLIRVNEHACLDLGYGGEEDFPGSLEVLCDVDDREKMERARQEALERGTSEVTLRLASNEDADRWHHLQLRSHTGDGGESFLFVTGCDVTRRVRRERRLKTRECILSSLIRNAGVGVVLLDRGGRILEANQGFTELFGYGEEELQGRNIDQLLSPGGEQSDAGKNLTSRAGSAGSSPYGSETVSKKGTSLAVLVDEIPVVVDEVLKVRYRIYTDITLLREKLERTEREREKQKSLLREVNHRVRNDLELATGFLQLQMYETEDRRLQQILIDSEVRIKSLAMIHELLAESPSLRRIDLKTYLENIFAFLCQVRDTTGLIELQSRIGKHYVHADCAVPCALLVVELFGAVMEQNSGRSCSLAIELSAERGEINLEVREGGKGLSQLLDPKDTGTLRHDFVTALVRQLDARMEWETTEGGETRLTFCFPDIESRHSDRFHF